METVMEAIKIITIIIHTKIAIGVANKILMSNSKTLIESTPLINQNRVYNQ